MNRLAAFSILMISAFTGLILFSTRAFTQQTWMDTEFCWQCDIEKSPAPIPMFTASEYFETIHPKLARKKDLPGRLYFEEANPTKDEMRELLIGNWRLQFSCGGRAVEYNYVKDLMHNGIDSPVTTFNFSDDHRFNRTLLRGLLQDESEPFRKVDITGTWTLIDDGQGHFTVDRLPVAPAKFRAMRIKGTGELVLINSRVALQFGDACRRGEKAITIYSKVPLA